ncbi:MAG TPA: 4'-phosphopantetheinyl transferase superfamily protein [Steroidobacteraceae bacterium]|nr:4'-phosphopantetheinyl transferase superfamily protein [Steroidobacteraceae bacterium]
MADNNTGSSRCGIDTVEIARIERLLAQTPATDLHKLFSMRELADSGDGPGRTASLAARVAAKEACVKLFPREAALGQIEPADFSVARDNYGAPQAVLSSNAQAVLARHRLCSIALSLTHDRTNASAVALAEPAEVTVPAAGRFLYRFVPLRRDVVLANLRRVFGDTASTAEIERLAAAHYGHLWRLVGEFIRFPWMSEARKRALSRVENLDALVAALAQGKGVLVLTGHFGNWEVATTAANTQFPHMRGKFHFVRRALKSRWLDRLVTHRVNQARCRVFLKCGLLDLDAVLARLEQGDVIVFPFDQHARPPDGIEVDFFGYPAWTFKSLAIIALATGAPVLPAAAWREPGGRRVLRFEETLPLIKCENTDEAIRRNTLVFNRALERLVLRHPEQWYWMQRRWKPAVGGRSPRAKR